MSNIPGIINALPGVYTDVETQSRGVAIPGGARITALIGEGSTDETIVSQAVGGGVDGLNPSYSSTSGADGRHFRLSVFPIIANRTTVFKNGIPLVGLEALIDSNPFNNKYDYRIDISTGKIELQRAHLVDQGGAFYLPLSTNVGDGYISNLTLTDPNAPPENWTIRCVGVQRNAMNQPIQQTAKFVAFGSVSGTILDANGNPIIWTTAGTTITNGILSFGINETQISNISTSPFVEGDAFTIKVASGVLVRSDSLTVNYIPTSNLNDPVLVQGMSDTVNRHGNPNIDNNLSLGAQLAFANAAPALITVQAAPSMPRRTSYVLEESVRSTSTNDDDFIFPLPAGVVPDFDSNIHFFVQNNTTNVESQILPNKLDFYTLNTSGQPTTHQFITSNSSAPAGWSYFYTVIQNSEILATGEDGYIGRDLGFTNKGTFSSSIQYDSSYVGKTVKLIDAVNTANIGSYTVNSVSSGEMYMTRIGSFSDFINGSSIAFVVIDPTTGLPVPSGSDTNGIITANVGTGTATLSSSTINFPSISGIIGFKLQINGSATDNGLYDISAPTGSGPYTITITKTVVNESNMRFEVVDTSDVSNYVVINKNIVPNGYGLRITIINSKDITFYDAGWINALESLEAVECDIVVPLPKQTISAIFQNTLNHCKSMSNVQNRKERVLICGGISGLTPDNLSGAEPAAVEDIGILEGIQGETITDVLAGNVEDLANYSVPDAFGNTYRCIYVYPDQIVVQAGPDNVLIDGFYIAAAAGGYLSADINIQNPLTNKVLSGFTILRNKQFSPSVLQQLASAGVCTLQPVAGGGRVVWGITTSQSGFPEEQEISIVFIRDRIAKILRAGFQGFIGNAETPDTGAILNTRGVVLMNSLVSQNLITAFKNLVIARDAVDPRQWNVSVAVQPTYPINIVYIKVSVGQL